MIDRFARRFAMPLLAAAVFCTGAAGKQAEDAGLPEAAKLEVDFVEHIQPILAENCVSCHGPASQMGNLRLDRKFDALEGGGTGRAIIPGDSAGSPMIQMTRGLNGLMRMPLNADPLPDEQVALLRAWIDQGAPWPDDGSDAAADEQVESDHWAFQPRAAIDPPQVNDELWVTSPIDRFVLAKLESKGIAPSLMASPETLLRRLSIDLTGLLPTVEDVERFAGDASPRAYEREVDRLLASPHFGERWARHWLDLARYADSDGYEKDLPRPYAYIYRDWVIDAINDDLPFDRFTVEQLAGDLLPDPTLDQIIATGFHRNTLTNREGGVDQEEYRIKAVKDRVNTTSAAWLGLTVACAECHNHKYDPISQKEYYGLFAFFNQAKEKDIPAPDPDQLAAYESRKAAFDVVHDRLQAALDLYDSAEFPSRFNDWLAGAEPPAERWRAMKPVSFSAVSGATHEISGNGDIFVGGEANKDDYTIVFEPAGESLSVVMIETVPHSSLPKGGASHSLNANFVISEFSMRVVNSADESESIQLEFVEASANSEQENWQSKHALDGDSETGWSPTGNYHLSHRAVFSLKEPVEVPEGWRLEAMIVQQYGDRHALGSFRILASENHPPLKARSLTTEQLSAWQAPASRRSAAQKAMLADYYRGIDPVRAQLARSLKAHSDSGPQYPPQKAMTIAENPEPPDSHIHVRGDFLRKGDEVEPHTLAVLHELNPKRVDDSPDRLDLARWIVSPDNPLTARVAANRVWQYLFGEGLVNTPEDFGLRGDKPSHPELLDWLAQRYIDLGWSRKALIKEIVMSSTYRQSSHARPDLIDIDPKNRLLARQNRYRLEAEIIRDISLQVSGLLNSEIGGPSIRPPLPADVAALGYANSVKWQQSEGDQIYRRGMYIFFQRTVPYPMLMTFDCPDSNVTVIRRNRSNTPLQALALLNDPVFWECAQTFGRSLAARDGGTMTVLKQAFRQALGREPSEGEAFRLGRLFNETYLDLMNKPDAARTIIDRMKIDGASDAEAAAWTAAARVLLNLEEFITRP